MARWALTGGIASGKSTVAKHFAQGGVPVVDADLVYHELIAPVGQPVGPSPLARAVTEAFPGVLRADHTLDRAALGAHIFNDPVARQKLEAITHPAVHQRAEQDLAAHEAAGHTLVLYDVPLLFERGLQAKFAGVVLVFVPLELQLQRLVIRNKLSIEAARARLNSQLPLLGKVPLSQFVIDNSGTHQETAAQVQSTIEQLRKL